MNKKCLFNKHTLEFFDYYLGALEKYSFCKKCWQSKTLGEDILRLIGFEGKMKLKDECLDIEVIGNNDKC